MVVSFYRSPFEWSHEHDDLLLREILLVELFTFKVGSSKRGNTYNLLETSLKKKIADEEKGSGINTSEFTDIERDIQEILKKSRVVQNEDIHNADKPKAEETRRKSLETIFETKYWVEDDEGSPKPRQKRRNGSENFAFLLSRTELESRNKIESRTTCYPKIGNWNAAFTAYSVATRQQHNIGEFPTTKCNAGTAKLANDDGFKEFSATTETVV